MQALVGSRLRIAVLLYVSIFVLSWATSTLLSWLGGGNLYWRLLLETLYPADIIDRAFAWGYVPEIISVLSLLAGLAIHELARRRAGDPRLLLRLALVFLVLSCLSISILEAWVPPPPYNIGISWVCMWLAIYPMLVPLPPRHALVAALIAATTGPLAVLLAHQIIGYAVSAQLVAWRFFPNYLAALAAWAASRFIYRLSRDAARASQIGSYRLIERIGRGGMGEVWRAEHELLARPAAIKLIPPEQFGPASPEAAATMIERFEREAKATAALGSGNTVEIFDYGVSDEGVFYYVMELLDGITLEALVARYGPQRSERVAFLLRQVCLSLEEAHRAGLLHRDIKPANIVMCRQGLEHDVIKVLDFGLVKATEAHHGLGSKLTADGVVFGTPAYMSPEAVQADVELDARSDIYSLGCVAYWLLTGEMVFGRHNPMNLLIAHVRDAPVPPSELLGVPVDAELEALVLSCLAKQPGDRPQSCLAMLEVLDRLAVAWTPARSRTWWAEHRPTKPEAAELGSADTLPAESPLVVRTA